MQPTDAPIRDIAQAVKDNSRHVRPTQVCQAQTGSNPAAEATRVRRWKIKRYSRRGSGRRGGRASAPGLFAATRCASCPSFGFSLPYAVSKCTRTISSSSDDVLNILNSFCYLCLLSERSIASSQENQAVIVQPRRTEEKMSLQAVMVHPPDNFFDPLVCGFDLLNTMPVLFLGIGASLLSLKKIHNAGPILSRDTRDRPRRWATTGPRPTLSDSSPYCIIETAVSTAAVGPVTSPRCGSGQG